MSFSIDLKAPPLNAHYEGEYSPRAINWRQLGAIDKARNIRSMVPAEEIREVLEVGCGTGAILAELRRTSFGVRHVGVDMADPNLHADPKAEGLDLFAYDGARVPFEDNSFDFVFASHVLEHVANEREFLFELGRVARRWVYIEVPCELNLRTTDIGLQRTLDIGHINAYTPESFALTLATSRLKLETLDIFDHSISVHAFNSTFLKACAKALIRRSLLKLSPKMASRIFTYHAAAICTPIDGDVD